MISWGDYFGSVATIGFAAAGGWLVSLSGIPLAWLIGAMLSTGVLGMSRFPVKPPNQVMPLVKASIGTMLGAFVTIEVLTSLGVWWPSFVCMAIVMIFGGVVNFLLMRRVFGFGKADAALCAVPGGIAEMILLSESAGAAQWRVAIVHALRIALAILTIPLLIGLVFDPVALPNTAAPTVPMALPDWGWFILCLCVGVVADRLTKIPARLILVPFALCAGLHLTGITEFDVPTQVSNLVQIFIGINVGARLVGVAPRLLMQVGLVAAVVVAVQITFAFGAALGIAAYLEASPRALSLAYAPGGLAEMSLIAVAMGEDVAVVGFHHILRVLGALFAGPLILKTIGRSA